MVWETFLDCFMIHLSLILKQESPLGIIRSLKFRNISKKPQEVMSHSQRHYFGYCAQENFQLITNLRTSKVNGEWEDIWITMLLITSQDYLRIVILWLCYLWPYYIFRKTPNLLNFMMRENCRNPNIGNINTKMQWIY